MSVEGRSGSSFHRNPMAGEEEGNRQLLPNSHIFSLAAVVLFLPARDMEEEPEEKDS